MSTTKKKSRVPKNWIIKLLRDISYKRPEYKEAKDKTRIDIGLYKCELCNCLMYEGTSLKRHEEYLVKHTEVKREKPQLDHKESVVDAKVGWQGYDVYIDRLFCAAEGLQVLCAKCHQDKTDLELQERVVTKGAKRGKDKN